MAEMRSSALDAYSFATALLFGREVNARMCARAYALPVRRWERMLALEGCAAPLYGAVRRRKDLAAVPEPLHQVLRESFRLAVQRGLQIQSQLAEIANVFSRS